MFSLRRLARSSIVRAVLSTLVIFLATVAARTPASYFPYVLTLIVAANFAFVYFAERRDTSRVTDQIGNILKLMVQLNWGDSKSVRANVMIPQDRGKKLKVAYSYNMDGHVDRKLKIGTKTGCAGKAFEEKAPYMVDLAQVKHGDYLIDASKVWDKMANILSVPIFDSIGENPIAVLSVDSSLPTTELKFDEKLGYVNMFADIIGKQVE